VGMRDRLAARAAHVGGQAKEAAATRVREAAESAKDVVAARTDGGLLGLVRMDDDRPVTIEAVTVLLVAAVRKDEGRGLDDRDVLKAAKRRYRRLGTISLPSGPIGGVLVTLYCEAATLCDVVEVRGDEMTDERVAAHLLVLWDVLPDIAVADLAVRGEGPGVVDVLRARALERVASLDLPDPMTKRAAVVALWRLNGLAGEAMELEGTGIRERLFPGRRVTSFVRSAHEHLDRSAF
jgi:hypothetical protein